ncbi:MAG: hypothetical protein U1C57_03785, partial [Candidatus Doudnabacteria bacterium]|nr:hypothetical protein [Candidatus Doudnabacteria bacterium]
FERVGEWFEVNVFTISTKAKQKKKLEFADERVAEIIQLASNSNIDAKDLRTAVSRYQNFLRQARDMAEKIIILDGKEIALAEQFEAATRLHETVLSSGYSREALAAAMIENGKIFKFMAVNYQFTDQDIKKHQGILDEHFEMIDKLDRQSKNQQVEEYLEEARKYQKAGLNVQAYDLIQKAKDILY